jgi:Cu(I)/Ag(I) efflux system membrane protein CusA/SilA
VNVEDVEEVLRAAVGGAPATETVEGRERYTVNVRYARDYRESMRALEQVLVPTRLKEPGKTQVPITEVADIEFRTGAPMIRTEDGERVGFVFIDLKGELGLADYVGRAKQVIDEQVDLPDGYRVGWAGQFKYFERAKAKLQRVIPITLLAVFLLLYLHRGRITDTLFVMLSVPFSLAGSVWLLFALGYNLSVAVWVGMIAMAGLAAELGLLMLHYLDHGLKEAHERVPEMSVRLLHEEIVQAASHRIRPMLMTGLVLLFSLIPVMLNKGTGADVMKRIAAPMVGGIASTLITVLLVFPAVFAVWKSRGSVSRKPE